MDDKSPVPAGDRPTNRQPPVSSLKDLKGMVLSEARNQYGCEFLHQKLQERKPEDIQMIFSELKDHISMLMLDRFGSYVIQKLFDVCDKEQINQLVFSVTADLSLLLTVCLDYQGSQSMLKLLECLTTPKQLSQLVSALKQIIVPLVNNRIGSCVIGHCFDFFDVPAKEAEQILGAIAENFFKIATSESGSFLLQFLISDVFRLHGQVRILTGIMLRLFALSINQFGNHVVQHVIGLGMPHVVGRIVAELRGGFVLMSKNIYASNVVKKLMEVSKETHAPEIINEIISSPDFLTVLQNPYGYCVVQSAKEYSTGTVRETLNHLILQHSDHLHGQRPGKNALPNKKRRRNHVLLIKNHVLQYKRRKRNHVLLNKKRKRNHV